MTNDQLARIERWIATGQRLDNYDANALLEQLRSNAADMVRVRKRLADAVRDLQLLERVRAHPALDWHLTDIEGARDAAESPEAREICELTMALLSPAMRGGGEGT